ncbi:hypothetical protein FM037_14550 [Shewanella psychropiezotolerans]|uniref:Uncharacterized protein n=1 Tax=Shewanella psychropiezotolerans TaxID=2593655 RepID=A0ABX5WYQ9_9GAMM|nr:MULTISPECIES: hypothetical protein [Shewanella]MPY23968.1 hypothetical protein [Shewanella sp. YLB-07]QDO84229.1 hypothetical protein FM037_14550 [Shewanella psychropiezotolerans]
MMASSLVTSDIEMLKRLLVIRQVKQDKLRRQLAQCRQVSKQQVHKSLQMQAERHELVVKLEQQVLPLQALSPGELVQFKLMLAKGYQQERALAEGLVTLKHEADELALTMETLIKDIQQLSKDQEKLKAVFDE